jgi:hypothetical protein
VRVWRLRNFVCRTFGHRRKYTESSRMVLTRRGYWQMRPCLRVRCLRCGLSGDDVYEWSRWERVVDACREFARKVEACKELPPVDDGIPF